MSKDKGYQDPDFSSGGAGGAGGLFGGAGGAGGGAAVQEDPFSVKPKWDSVKQTSNTEAQTSNAETQASDAGTKTAQVRDDNPYDDIKTYDDLTYDYNTEPEISYKNWLGTLVVSLIPGVNVAAWTYWWATSQSHTRKNFAKAGLTLMTAAAVIAIGARGISAMDALNTPARHYDSPTLGTDDPHYNSAIPTSAAGILTYDPETNTMIFDINGELYSNTDNYGDFQDMGWIRYDSDNYSPDDNKCYVNMTQGNDSHLQLSVMDEVPDKDSGISNLTFTFNNTAESIAGITTNSTYNDLMDLADSYDIDVDMDDYYDPDDGSGGVYFRFDQEGDSYNDVTMRVYFYNGRAESVGFDTYTYSY